MELSIYQRLETLRISLNLSQKALCRAINISDRSYNQAIKRESDVGFSLLNAVLTTFDRVSPEWLMLGKGDMFRHPEAASSPTNSFVNSTFNGQTNIAQSVTVNNTSSTELLTDEIANLRRENASLLEINRQLQEQNQMLTKKI